VTFFPVKSPICYATKSKAVYLDGWAAVHPGKV